MLMNMVLGTGESSSQYGSPVSVTVYGAVNETVAIYGNISTTLTLNSSGVGTISLASGPWMFMPRGECDLVYPNGLSVVISATNNIVYLRPSSTAYWYNLTDTTGGFVNYDQQNLDPSIIIHPSGSSSSGYTITIHSNSKSEYWARACTKNAISILDGNGNKYKKIKILATGTTWTANYVVETTSGYHTPYMKSQVGIIETGGTVSVNSSSKTVVSLSLSGVSGTTVRPFVKAVECCDPGGGAPGNFAPNPTIYGFWFE